MAEMGEMGEGEGDGTTAWSMWSDKGGGCTGRGGRAVRGVSAGWFGVPLLGLGDRVRVEVDELAVELGNLDRAQPWQQHRRRAAGSGQGGGRRKRVGS